MKKSNCPPPAKPRTRKDKKLIPHTIKAREARDPVITRKASVNRSRPKMKATEIAPKLIIKPAKPPKRKNKK